MKISVCVITYNHEKYISNTLASILSQKNKHEIEIIICDDCSTDKTVEIVRSFQKKHKNQIRFYSRKKNIGPMLNFIDCINKSKGKYIALCEGDDYWTNNQKLLKQIKFLENHKDFAICSHNVTVHDIKSNTKSEWLGKNHREVSTIEDIIRYGSGGATCSLVFRSKVKSILPEWIVELPSGDWVLQIFATNMGKMKYLTENMAVYQRHDTGMTAIKSDTEFIRIYKKGGVDICKRLDKHFEYKYNDDFEYNLVNYFYPKLIKGYKTINDIKNIIVYYEKLIFSKSFWTIRYPMKIYYLVDYFRYKLK